MNGDEKSAYDVVVVGTGMAGIAAALAAQEAGARVLVLEKAPRESAGGSTRFSGGGFRAPQGTFTADDLFDDFMSVTQRRGNAELLRNLADRAADGVQWLAKNGMTWVDPRSFRPDARARKVQLFTAKPAPFKHHGVNQIGAGNGAVQMMHRTLLERTDVRFETKAERLIVDGKRRVTGIRTYDANDGYIDVRAGAVVLASGGFQANTDWRVRYFGRYADEWRVRGTRFNTGDGIKMAMEIGAAPVGQWGDFHSPVIDARSALVECGETNVNAYPFTIMVNTHGRRFLDEGEDFRDRTYAKFGKAILLQPGSLAHLIWDAKAKDLVTGLVSDWGPTVASDLDELGSKLGIDAATLRATIQGYNAAVQPGAFDPETKDGKRTVGITPAKSNWAQTIDTPPYYAYTVTGGITFSFGGLKIDPSSRVIDDQERPIAGLFAAGEILGDFFYHNYPSGSSLTRSTVYGRIAGGNAAKAALADRKVSVGA